MNDFSITVQPKRKKSRGHFEMIELQRKGALAV